MKLTKNRIFRKLFAFMAIIILCFLLWEHQLLVYGIRQGYGQWRVLRGTQPIADYLQKPEVPDSLKEKVRLIQEIKRFAEDSLGIKPSENYTSIFDQQGKPILWIVTACPPFALEAYEWRFSFLGKFSYKGHFERHHAEQDSALLAAQGYEAAIDEVSAWSTLGWFKDPILSSMLYRSEGSLANLIIHELTHGTLYVKDDVDFNENLASFIGDQGALRFLAYKFGENSLPYQAYLQRQADIGLFDSFMLQAAQRLQALYTAPAFVALPLAEKQAQKQKLIQNISNDFDQLPFQQKERYRGYFEGWQVGNPFFMGFLRYRAQQYDFEQVLHKEYQGDLRRYLEFLKTRYPSL
jgi:predicted aminopeptidase